MFSGQITLFLKIIKRIFYIFGGFLLFFFIIEMIRAVQTLAFVHPILAWIAGITMLGFIIWGYWKVSRLLKNIPSTPTAPDPEKLGGFNNPVYLKAQLFYLHTIVKSMSKNNSLSIERQNILKLAVEDESIFSTKGENETLMHRIAIIDTDLISPSLDELDKQAENIVKNTVRDTMIGVMLLPFKAVDIYLVIYRNSTMFLNLIRLYNQKPGPIQTYHVFRDVLKIVATVHVLNYAERFTQRIMASVPFLDKTIDDIIQGTGAGVLTTAVGKATILRCRSYSNWNADEQIENYRKTTVDFLVYVKEIFTQDVLPNMSKPWNIAWGYIKGYFDKNETTQLKDENGATIKKLSWKERVKFWGKGGKSN